MMRIATLCLLPMLLTASETLAATECNSVNSPPKINGILPWTSGSAVGFQRNVLNVDADGAPDSYRVDGNGLSYTCDGISALVNGVPQTPENNPAHWQELCRNAWAAARQSNDYSKVRIFGFMTDQNNRPIVQGDGDPLPGQAFITTTSMSMPSTPDKTQRHYVNANEIPFVVLPAPFVSKYGVKAGDVAVVYWPAKKKHAFGVFADNGRLGEASVRLHQDLGNNPIVVKGGVKRAKVAIEGTVMTVVFPGSAPTPTVDSQKWREDIDKAGQAALDKWGGIDKLAACVK